MSALPNVFPGYQAVSDIAAATKFDTAWAIITDRVAPGIVFDNIHLPGAANVNNLTSAALDPAAKIPEYKVCAVAMEAIT